MNVEDLLRHKQARLIAVRTDDTLADAARLLHREGIGAVLVQDVCPGEGNTAVGMFSERDLVRGLAEHGADALKKRVSDFMSRDLCTCAPRDSVEHAFGLMHERHIRHLPVLDEFTSIGVISMRDVMSASVGMVRQQSQLQPSAG